MRSTPGEVKPSALVACLPHKPTRKSRSLREETPLRLVLSEVLMAVIARSFRLLCLELPFLRTCPLSSPPEALWEEAEAPWLSVSSGPSLARLRFRAGSVLSFSVSALCEARLARISSASLSAAAIICLVRLVLTSSASRSAAEISLQSALARSLIVRALDSKSTSSQVEGRAPAPEASGTGSASKASATWPCAPAPRAVSGAGSMAAELLEPPAVWAMRCSEKLTSSDWYPP